ncbi:MAG: DUF1622 domain-containing protein [Cyanobacteria bacterium Co-bin13]|nr:DUF1622 domain-containing protein [Cyanobacteria bacterium Co-bin13]
MSIEALSQNMALTVRVLNGFLTSTCQLLALVVILIGVVRAMVIYLKEGVFQGKTSEAFQHSRLTMGYAFSLGLSFLVGASILKTMISSQWDDIARLSVIIAVRTVLNLLLERAIRRGSPTLELSAATEQPSA